MESYVFDSFDDAQIALIERQLAVRKIRLGRVAPETVDWTFDDLVEVWLCHRASQKRSGKDDESIIRCHLLPAGECVDVLE